MKYFLHDSNAFSDEKITELYINYGYEGIGLFFTILEKMACQEKPIKTIVLKKQLGVGKKLEKCWNFMESLDLISSNNGETFNKQLLKFSEKYQIKKEKNKERIANWRYNSEKNENVTCYKSVRNTRKDKISKVNKSKSNLSNLAVASKFPINEIIKLFEEVNPSYERFYSNITQRSALERLLKKYGEQNVRGLIKYLPIMNEDKYAKGKAISPLELETNLTHINNHYKQKVNSNKIIEIPE